MRTPIQIGKDIEDTNDRQYTTVELSMLVAVRMLSQ